MVFLLQGVIGDGDQGTWAGGHSLKSNLSHSSLIMTHYSEIYGENPNPSNWIMMKSFGNKIVVKPFT